MRVNIEVTDTFGGEANYSWVTRNTIEMPDKLSDLAIVRRVKKEIGWNGERCRTRSYGDLIDIRPRHACYVCFVTFPSTDEECYKEVAE